MCGICGVVNTNGKAVDPHIIKMMCESMKHRGPDGEGIYTNSDCGLRTEDLKSKLRISIGLGHRRLSIIDLSQAGHQPMCNENGDVWLVLNGEIYNYISLRDDLKKKGHKFKSATDSEVILHLYEEYGENCVKHLCGMFAFAIWDEREGSLMLARDRPGKKPLLYSYNNETFVFASEFSSLLSSGLIKRDVNLKAIDSYLSFGYIPAPMSIYKDVFKVNPAHILIFKNGEIVTKKYWEQDYLPKAKVSETEAEIETLRLLRESVKMRLQSDVPVGAFLSGGLDSSAVVGIMSEFSTKKVKTFSIGFDVPGYNELDHANTIAKHFETEHHEFVVKPDALEILPDLVEHYGEPYADSSAIPTYYVSKQTKEYVTVALNGDGADEVFAGYERYKAMRMAEIYHNMPGMLKKCVSNCVISVFPDSVDPKNKWNRLRRFIKGASLPAKERYQFWVGIFPGKLKNELYTVDFKHESAGSNDLLCSDIYSDKGLDLVDRLLSVDSTTYLPNDLLVKVDIASMANSLEARSPFLDHKLMEFAASLPANYKMKFLKNKYILKKAVSRLLPAENISRKKMGFGVPMERWLREDLRPFMVETLLSSASLNRGYFKPNVIKGLVEDHIKGICDYSSQLWALLMLELWHQKFID